MNDRLFTLEDMMLQVAREARPEERLSVSEAARKYIYVNQPGSFVGQFDPDYTPYMREPSDTLSSREFTGLFFCGPVQTGKALDVKTPILTPSGWSTMGDLKVGDYVFAPDGKPTKVTFATPLQFDRTCYEVEFDDGSCLVADADHLWEVKDIHRQNPEVLTTKQILDRGVRCRKQARFTLPPLSAAVETRNTGALYADPYVLGYWLGDGSRQSGTISVGDQDVQDFVLQMKRRGYSTEALRRSPGRVGQYRVRRDGSPYVFLEELARTGLRENRVRAEKYIPDEYLMAPPEQRRELLRGLLDSDGHLGRRGRQVEFSSSEERLSQGVAYLARSLGYRPRVAKHKTSLYGAPHSPRYRVTWGVYDPAEVFSLARKAGATTGSEQARKKQTTCLRIKRITPTPTRPVRCIQVEHETALFLAGRNLVPTHNTNMLSSWVAHGLKIEPADLILYTMTQSAASDFTVNRIDRLFQNNPDLGRMLLKGSSSDSMYRKMFRNGMILTISWPSPTEFASRSVPRVFLTDYDRMPQNVGGEGSPFVLAEKRTTTYRRNAMAAAESTPSFPIKDLRWTQKPEFPHEAPPTDGILGLYNQGDRRRWLWHCVSCHNSFEPDFKLLRWPESIDIMESAQSAYMACPHCGQVYEHDGSDDAPSKNEMNLQHAKWLREGQLWLPDGTIGGTARRSRYASFWLKGPAARFQTWETIVFEYLTALDHFNRTLDETLLQSTVNTRQALPYRPRKAETLRSPDSIRERAMDLGNRVVPPGGRFLVATVDVQKSRFVVQVHAFGPGNDIWIIDRFDVKVSKRPDEEAGGFKWVQPGAHAEDWDLLIEQVISKTYPLSDDSGREMPIWLTLCDSGGQEGVTKNAYDFWRRLRWPPQDEAEEDRVEVPVGAHAKFQLVIGRPVAGAPRYQITFPDSQRKDRYAGAKGEIPVGRINSDPVKDAVDNALDREEPGGGRINFPNWLPKDFYDELCAESRDEKGRWEKISKRNESWDLLAYAFAATLDKRINLERPQFWDNPPPWAAPWDENTFLIQPNADNEDPKPKTESAIQRLKRLGSENA